MSNTTTPALSSIAASYADKSAAAENAAKRLAEHPDTPAHLAAFITMRDEKVWGAANIVARQMLDLPADEPIKKGPAGQQKTTTNGRRIETLARWITRNADKADDDDDKPVVLRVSLSGQGGGTVTVPNDHPMYAELVALVTGEAADED